MRYQNILGTVGHTPVVRINKLAPEHVNLWVKVEAFNPLVGQGPAGARRHRGGGEIRRLKPGMSVVEATSGNTGIGLAMVCAVKGYPLVITMAESFSIERRRLMRLLGAEVILTPAALRATGMIVKTKELAKKHGWFYVRQFENEANPDMHTRTTAREIMDEFKGEQLDYWVTGFGTGGTLKGVARVLAKESPKTKVVVCEPADAALIASGLPQERNADGSPAAGHPGLETPPHAGLDAGLHSQNHRRCSRCEADRQAPHHSRTGRDKVSQQLARKEGIFVGITAGATFAGALQIAAEAPKGANILCMLPDTGERYLSTPLFADIPAEMTKKRSRSRSRRLTARQASCRSPGLPA